MNKLYAVIIAILIGAILIVSAAFYTYFRISNDGNIHTIGVTADITVIHWGFMRPTENKSSPSFTVTNNGTLPIVLSMTTENWLPSPDYFACGWNLESVILEPNENATAIVWLSVDAGIENVTSFGFDIILIGQEEV